MSAITTDPANDTRMALCTSSCNDYADGTAVMVGSFFENNRWYNGEIIVVTWGRLSADRKCHIASLYPKTRFLEVNEEVYSSAQIKGSRKWNYVPALRFSIFKLAGYSRIVYVDADAIVLADIRELFDTSAAFGACRLKNGAGMELATIGGFNAGVLTIGAEFLSEQVHDELLRIATSRLWSGNQTVLNMRFAKDVTYLPTAFNTTTDQLTRDSLEAAKILHFIGEEKPWHLGSRISERRIEEVGESLAFKALAIWDEWAAKFTRPQ